MIILHARCMFVHRSCDIYNRGVYILSKGMIGSIAQKSPNNFYVSTTNAGAYNHDICNQDHAAAEVNQDPISAAQRQSMHAAASSGWHIWLHAVLACGTQILSCRPASICCAAAGPHATALPCDSWVMRTQYNAASRTYMSK